MNVWICRYSLNCSNNFLFHPIKINSIYKCHTVYFLWNFMLMDSAGDKYSRLVSDASARRRFIQNLVPYLEKYGFSGIHFDWNYPRCWQSDCRKGPESDRPNFTKLIKEISTEFQKHGLILGVGISGYKEIIAKSYEIEALSNAADFLTIMTYGMPTFKIYRLFSYKMNTY